MPRMSEWEKLLSITLKDIVRGQLQAIEANHRFCNTPYEELPSEFRRLLGNMTNREFWRRLMCVGDTLVSMKLMEFRRLAVDEMRAAYRCWWV